MTNKFNLDHTMGSPVSVLLFTLHSRMAPETFQPLSFFSQCISTLFFSGNFKNISCIYTSSSAHCSNSEPVGQYEHPTYTIFIAYTCIFSSQIPLSPIWWTVLLKIWCVFVVSHVWGYIGWQPHMQLLGIFILFPIYIKLYLCQDSFVLAAD